MENNHKKVENVIDDLGSVCIFLNSIQNNIHDLSEIASEKYVSCKKAMELLKAQQDIIDSYQQKYGHYIEVN